jgi:flagellar biosynthetic protein FlhB
MVGPDLGERLANGMRGSLSQAALVDPVQQSSVGSLILGVLTPAFVGLKPVIFACAAAAIVINVTQTGFKPATQALKPDPKRLNPVTGAKNIFGPNSLVETLKGILKIGVVGTVVLMALLPRLSDLAGLVGISPIELSAEMARSVKSIALRAAIVYMLIGILDYFYQRYRTEKSLKMDKQEVKDEAKGQDLPAEVKAALRRRQMQQARQRMMADIPNADVVVTNPTHYAVALKYEAGSSAPIVVAKGMDHLAAKIREAATQAGIPLVPDPPLARALHKTVEVGQEIPEDLFEAVAAVLAHVYRVARRNPLAATAS